MGEALRFLRHGVGSQQGLRRVPGPAERTLARLVGVFRSILAQLIFEGFAQEVARSVQAFRNRTSERLFGERPKPRWFGCHCETQVAHSWKNRSFGTISIGKSCRQETNKTYWTVLVKLISDSFQEFKRCINWAVEQASLVLATRWRPTKTGFFSRRKSCEGSWSTRFRRGNRKKILRSKIFTPFWRMLNVLDLRRRRQQKNPLWLGFAYSIL